MTIHEFGKENEKAVLLIHPSCVMWDYFEYVIPLLEKRFHLIVPALPGYDKDRKSDFESVEKTADELTKHIMENIKKEIACIYGCSMGGSIIIRMLAEGRIKPESAVIDGGIAPYRMPYILTRFIAVKDFILIMLGKAGGAKLLQRAFTTDNYSKKELEYIAVVLKMMSARTVWNTFDSCNNFSLPATNKTGCENIEYWYAESETKDREKDIKFVKNNIPNIRFKMFKGIGHGGLATKLPDTFAKEITRMCERTKND
ncbi:MAG: alpha/beta hydrolase [Clostridia bacterium]|nr:alpha/beta hydrolase [Clostridia bacterium]